MEVPKAFDGIRPFNPDEMPAVFNRLFADKQFLSVLDALYPGVPHEAIHAKLSACHSLLEFQRSFVYQIVDGVMKKASRGYDMDAGNLDRNGSYTFMSNHRDIVMDSAVLDVLLVDNGFRTTCEIAIGDNLLRLPWVKDVARLNKAFIVRRGLSMRETLMASKLLSAYMHFAISEKKENIWIAQREGRAKDSDDRTSKAVLQMLAMEGEGSLPQRLASLHIVPLAISYEYDPCDYLKARELQQRRDDANFKKGPTDDIVSMQTGIMGFKGRVHYKAAPCIDSFLLALDPAMPKSEQLRAITAHIDTEIHRGYRLFPSNYVAADMLEQNTRFADHYSADEKALFEQYIATQLAKIELENSDEDFLRRSILTMYANPLYNKLNVNG